MKLITQYWTQLLSCILAVAIFFINENSTAFKWVAFTLVFLLPLGKLIEGKISPPGSSHVSTGMHVFIITSFVLPFRLSEIYDSNWVFVITLIGGLFFSNFFVFSDGGPQSTITKQFWVKILAYSIPILLFINYFFAKPVHINRYAITGHHIESSGSGEEATTSYYLEVVGGSRFQKSSYQEMSRRQYNRLKNHSTLYITKYTGCFGIGFTTYTNTVPEQKVTVPQTNNSVSLVDSATLGKLEIVRADYLAIFNKTDSNTESQPKVLELKKGKKQLLFVGVTHGNDPNDPKFRLIKNKFYELEPEIVIYEGGPTPNDTAKKTINNFRLNSYRHRNSDEPENEFQAMENGEVGYLKYFCDNENKYVKRVNGDCDYQEVCRQLLAQYPRNEVLYFLFAQLFLSQHSGMIVQHPVIAEKMLFRMFTYRLLEYDIKLSLAELTWNFYDRMFYKRYNKKLLAATIDELNTAVRDDGRNSDIAIRSLQIRDSTLVNTIYNNFKAHNKVMVVFGEGHLLANQGTLERLFK